MLWPLLYGHLTSSIHLHRTVRVFEGLQGVVLGEEEEPVEDGWAESGIG